MSERAFINADPQHPGWRSPLARALANAPAGIRDVSAEADGADIEALGPVAGVAGIEIDAPFAPRLLARMTDVDLDALPTIAAVSHIRARIEHDDDRFRIWFPQEYADYLAEVVLDAWEGLTDA